MYKNQWLKLIFLSISIQVSKNSKWHERHVVVEFIQSLVFCNLFNARPYAKRLHQLVTTCLFDEGLEVRTAASVTLSGLYQCGYFQTINEDLVEWFCFIFITFEMFIFDFHRTILLVWLKQNIWPKRMTKMSNRCKTWSKDMEVSIWRTPYSFWFGTFFKWIFSVVVGILGLCAIVLSNPYDISVFTLDALTLLCKYSNDPDPMQVNYLLLFTFTLNLTPHFFPLFFL